MLANLWGMKQAELKLALVGCGGQAGGDVPNFADHPSVKIVAVCDPDKTNRDKFGTKYGVPEGARYADYKKLLSDVPCDAVFCATPDHMHAPVGLAALRKNKHVYLQKPLARGVAECRALADEARKRPKLATQMGIQIHGDAAYRSAVTWLRGGIVGRVREVHSFCAKGWGGPQAKKPADPVPDGLDWDIYCGVSPFRPYVKGDYHPGNWRRWQAFGTGTLGDMGCHILDPVFGGTGLISPRTVKSHLAAPPNDENFPYDMHIEWGFDDDVNYHWYSGDVRPDASILPGVSLPGAGSLVIGERARLLVPHWSIPTLYDASGTKLNRTPRPEPAVNHYHEWVDAALASNPSACGANFAFAGPLTECVLMGNIASWQPQKQLTWDGRRCRFVGEGSKEANKHLTPSYRRGVRL